MSIRKKMIIFVSMVVIGPMLFIFILSNIVLNNQIEKAAQGYLQNAFIIARDQMINRLSEMGKVSTKTTNSLEFQEALQDGNTNKLNSIISDIDEVYDYNDFYMVFDENKKLKTSQPNINNPKFSRLNILIDEAEKNGKTITSEEQFDLGDLFSPNSEKYNVLNENLEEKVKLRTQDLREAIVEI